MNTYILLGYDLSEHKEKEQFKNFLTTPMAQKYIRNKELGEITMVQTFNPDRYFLGYLLWVGSEDAFKKQKAETVDFSTEHNHLLIVDDKKILLSKPNFDTRQLEGIYSCIVGSKPNVKIDVFTPTEENLEEDNEQYQKILNSIDSYNWILSYPTGMWQVQCPHCGYLERHSMALSGVSLPNMCPDCNRLMKK